MTTSPRKTAVVYVRLSSYAGVDEDPSTSPARQRQACSAYALAKGWDVVDVIEDLDVSGSDKGLRLDRPGLQRVRAALPDVDVVIFAKLDRLCRNVIDFRTFADEAAGHGAALVSVEESLDLSTPTGTFVATIIAAFAEMEAATIAARTRAGKQAALALGRFVGGTPPLGFRVVDNPAGPGRVLEVDEAEAAEVLRVVEMLGAGESWKAAARYLNTTSIKPRRAASWTIKTVQSALESDAVQTRLLDATQRRSIKAARGERIGGQRPSRLLSTLLRCGSCGAPLVVGASHTENPVYRCSAGSTGGAKCPAPVSTLADAAESAISDAWLESWGEMQETTSERLSDATDAQIREIDAAHEVASAAVTRTRGAERRAALDELERLEAERERLEAMPRTALRRLVETGRTYGAVWAATDTDGRRELLRSTVAPMAISPSGRGYRRTIIERLDPESRSRLEAE